MSSESDEEYANRFDRADHRHHRCHRYQFYSYDDDDDDDSKANRRNHHGRRSSSSSRNPHRRRNLLRSHYYLEKSRRPTVWTSHTAARIMAVCLLFSFAAYEVSILRSPFATDLFRNVPSNHRSVKLDRSSIFLTKTNTSYHITNPTPVQISSQIRSGAGSSNSVASTNSTHLSVSVPSSTSNFNSEYASPLSFLGRKKISDKKQNLSPPRLSYEIPADSNTDVDLPFQDEEQLKTSSDAPSDSSITKTSTGSEHKKNNRGDRPSTFRLLRRRRRKRSHLNAALENDRKSETRSEPPSSDLVEKTTEEPISALRINISVADQPADKAEQTLSLSSLTGERESAISFMDSNSKDRDSNDDAKAHKLDEKKKVGSTPSTNYSTNGGSEPGVGQNFWQWFQESKGNSNQSVAASVQCPNDVKRLCTMFYKYLRKYKIRTVYDASCGKNIDWMPDVLKTAGGELWGFKYYCCSNGEKELQKAKEKLSSFSYVQFVSDAWWITGFPKETEMLFAWDTLAHIAFGRVWNFFVKAKSSGIKYILIDNYPSITNDPSPNRQFINVRRHPFKFPQAKEVAQNVTEPGETLKRQLLFYETESLPENLQ